MVAIVSSRRRRTSVGRRGRNGLQALVLDAAALARGEDCRDVTLANNLWEQNFQAGCALIGVIGASVSNDTAKNNGQQGGVNFGFVVIQRSISPSEGVPAFTRRSSDVCLMNIRSIDDQAVPTQHTAVGVLASDNVKIVNPIMRGNSARNRVYYDASAIGLEVTGDGKDGATKKRVASYPTGSIAAATAVTITIPFITPFDVPPNWDVWSVETASTSTNLRVIKTVARTASVIQVQVRNDAAVAAEGTLSVEAAYIS